MNVYREIIDCCIYGLQKSTNSQLVYSKTFSFFTCLNFAFVWTQLDLVD